MKFFFKWSCWLDDKEKEYNKPLSYPAKKYTTDE